jgi:hypothetical protein
MPPRRPPRRGKKHGHPGAPALAGVALKDIRRANTLMERGEHANAAQLFERQARDAGDRGLHLQSAHLHLQAGRARLLAGEVDTGADHLRLGLKVLSERGKPRRLALSGNLLLNDLENLGQVQLEQELRNWLEQSLADHPDAGANLTQGSSERVPLPIKCSKCGAILRGEDIERWDAGSLVCLYCGSLIGL